MIVNTAHIEFLLGLFFIGSVIPDFARDEPDKKISRGAVFQLLFGIALMILAYMGGARIL